MVRGRRKKENETRSKRNEGEKRKDKGVMNMKGRFREGRKEERKEQYDEWTNVCTTIPLALAPVL